eukprot:UN01860
MFKPRVKIFPYVIWYHEKRTKKRPRTSINISAAISKANSIGKPTAPRNAVPAPADIPVNFTSLNQNV